MLMHDIWDRAASFKKSFLAQSLFGRCLWVILFPAVATYVLLSFFTGGEARRGREVAGHFFVAHDDGASKHEVSGTIFYFSLWLGRMIGCLWLIGMTAGLIKFVLKWLRKSDRV